MEVQLPLMSTLTARHRIIGYTPGSEVIRFNPSGADNITLSGAAQNYPLENYGGTMQRIELVPTNDAAGWIVLAGDTASFYHNTSGK